MPSPQAEPVEAFEPPWGDTAGAGVARRSRRWRILVAVTALLVLAGAYFVPCWRGRIGACSFWCSAGATAACNVLARSYDDGDGTDIRDDLAVSFYRQACDGGNNTACVNLGIMYESAEGVAPDVVQAADLYRRGCPEKLSACRRLASLMVDQRLFGDPAVAKTLERACDGHDDEAMKSCNALARMYDNGSGVPRDDRHAARLYRRACEGHLDVACFNLSLMYRRGEGVARDDAEADALEARSCQKSKAARCRR